MVLTLTPYESLRIASERKGLSRGDAAKVLGCSQKYLSMIEAGRVESLGLEIAFAIEREFEIPAESWVRVA